jgi:hypothetical protein
LRRLRRQQRLFEQDDGHVESALPRSTHGVRRTHLCHARTPLAQPQRLLTSGTHNGYRTALQHVVGRERWVILRRKGKPTADVRYLITSVE